MNAWHIAAYLSNEVTVAVIRSQLLHTSVMRSQIIDSLHVHISLSCAKSCIAKCGNTKIHREHLCL